MDMNGTAGRDGLPGRISRGSRAARAPPDDFDPSQPRLGRRESEPHSDEVVRLHDLLTTNYPRSRAL
ncbi:MAG: hypothetical protein ACTSU5_14135 [Promethearchaeota archaeon]